MSDLLALLDTLDGLHGAATSAECWRGSWDSRPYARDGFPWATFAIGPQHGIPADPTTGDTDRDAYDRGAAARNADVAWVRTIVSHYPRLSAALRAALTPTTDGEREAREALVDMERRIPLQWQVHATRGMDQTVRNFLGQSEAEALRDRLSMAGYTVHGCRYLRDTELENQAAQLRGLLNLLDAERAKAADAARERAAIVADIRAMALSASEDNGTARSIRAVLDILADRYEHGGHITSQLARKRTP